ncbi:MAG: hypothetical protein ABI402_05035 [Ferruginibacter sp.]
MRIIIKYVEPCLLILVISSIVFQACNNDKTVPCLRGGYSFAVTSEWSPQKETYHIGDTIYFISNFPKTMTDQVNTSLSVDYSNSVGIQGDITIICLDSVAQRPVLARDSFDLFSVKGNFSELAGSQNGGIAFNYNETNLNYEFVGAFICQKKGIYGIGAGDLSSRGLRGDDCTNAGFTMTVTNSEQHLYLHYNALHVDTTDIDLRQRGYDFRVE